MKKDPTTLRPHPLIKAMPRWPKDSVKWGAFVEDIRANGIRSPIKVTEDGVVVDGETRRLASLDLQMAEVPVEIVGADEAIEIILRELCLRRNLTQGQRAYVAYPLLEPLQRENTARRIKNLQKGQCFPDGLLSRPVDKKGRAADQLAAQLGLSGPIIEQAAKVHRLLDEHPEWRDKYEASIFDPEHPAGLGRFCGGWGTRRTRYARRRWGWDRTREAGRRTWGSNSSCSTVPRTWWGSDGNTGTSSARKRGRRIGGMCA